MTATATHRLPPSRQQAKRDQAQKDLTKALAAIEYLKGAGPLLITTQDGVPLAAPASAVCALRPLLLAASHQAASEARTALA